MVRKTAKESKELLEKRLSEVSARWTDPLAAPAVAAALPATIPALVASTHAEVLEEDSSSSDDDSINGMETEVINQLSTTPNRPTEVEVPDVSYFEIRRDKEKRAYVECFTDIVGRVKTNYQFRCKGCGETLIGQYLNMLVHMSGKYNHLTVRARACTNPFPAIKAKILQDYADYNAKQQYLLSQIKQETGAFLGKKSAKPTLPDRSITHCIAPFISLQTPSPPYQPRALGAKSASTKRKRRYSATSLST